MRKGAARLQTAIDVALCELIFIASQHSENSTPKIPLLQPEFSELDCFDLPYNNVAEREVMKEKAIYS